MKCVVGRWRQSLDKEDKEALKQAISQRSRAELHGFICAAHGGAPFGLTALKDCLGRRCICNRKVASIGRASQAPKPANRARG